MLFSKLNKTIEKKIEIEMEKIVSELIFFGTCIEPYFHIVFVVFKIR